MRKLSILFILLLTASVSIFSQSDNNAPDFPQVKAPTELMKASPAQVGIDALALESGIRAIILEALDSAAFPGCQILLAKGGKIFYEESFGYHTYDKRIAVKNSDIYDLASVTKTTAATLSLMKLYDQGLFDPNETFGHYFPDIAKGKKKNLVMRDVLAHQAGLRAWIPYYS